MNVFCVRVCARLCFSGYVNCVLLHLGQPTRASGFHSNCRRGLKGVEDARQSGRKLFTTQQQRMSKCICKI